MITKQDSDVMRTNNKVLVLFSMPPIDDCGCLYLVEKFTDEWNESVYRMQRADDVTWSLAFEIACDYHYQYRYRTDKGVWYNEPANNVFLVWAKDDSNEYRHS